MLCKQEGKTGDPPRPCVVMLSSSSSTSHGDSCELVGGSGHALEARGNDENGAKKTRNAKVAGMGRATHSMANGLVQAANPSPAMANQG